MAKFSSREDVDKFYRDAADGLGMAWATLKSGPQPREDDLTAPRVDISYSDALKSLYRVVEGVYKTLGIDEPPKEITMADIFNKHCGRPDF
jgi:hypothetical protein